MELIRYPHIEDRIYTIRGIQVMIDRDLAEIYQVETRVLNQAVRRNIERFPESFRFQLNEKEFEFLRSQIVTLKTGRGKHSKYNPYAFTEQGVAMLSSVLRSKVAVEVSIQIMQAFVNMRKFIFQNASVFQRLDQLEIKQLQTDEKFERVFKDIGA